MLEQYDLGNLMVLDIETVPQYSSFDEVPEHFQKLWDLKTQYQRKEETPEAFYERAGIWAGEYGFCGAATNTGEYVGLWRRERIYGGPECDQRAGHYCFADRQRDDR